MARDIATLTDCAYFNYQLAPDTHFKRSLKLGELLDRKSRHQEFPHNVRTPQRRLLALRELSSCGAVKDRPILVTASMYIVTHRQGKCYVLLAPHPKYQGLELATGGHVESYDESVYAAARRERREELPIGTLSEGKLLTLTREKLSPCKITGQIYHSHPCLFDVGCRWDSEGKLTSFDMRVVEYIPNTDTSSAFSTTTLSSQGAATFRFKELTSLCQAESNHPDPAILRIDPTYYQRFIALNHFLEQVFHHNRG